MAANTSRRLRLRLRGGGVIVAAPGDSFTPAVIPLRVPPIIDARVSWVQLEIPGVAEGGGPTLKYWTGAAWVEKPLKRWNGAAWVNTGTLKRWSGAAWV
jgi:hypothetical protein